MSLLGRVEGNGGTTVTTGHPPIWPLDLLEGEAQIGLPQHKIVHHLGSREDGSSLREGFTVSPEGSYRGGLMGPGRRNPRPVLEAVLCT